MTLSTENSGKGAGMNAIQICINYQMALRKADKLQNIADRMRRFETQDYEEFDAEVGDAWKGENADACRGKAAGIQSEYKKMADTMEETAETLRRIAKRIYDSDMASYELALRRIYQGI
jgi:uncharacterized protein YukE